MKNSTLIIGVIVVVAIIIIFAVFGGRSDNPTTLTPTTTVASSISTSVAPSTSVATAPRATSTPSAAQNLNYNQALDKYGATRIQFGLYCNATPNHMVIKSGTTVMLDNRSGDARTISLDTTKYSLVGYGFRLVYLTTSTSSRTVTIDCGGAQNVGQIVIQK